MVDQRLPDAASPRRKMLLPPKPLELILLTLLLAGCVLPFVHLIPWLMENGLDLSRFQDELFGTAIGRFFGWDVIVAVVTLLVAALFDRRLNRRERLLVTFGALAGASVGLPLYLWLHTRNQRCVEV